MKTINYHWILGLQSYEQIIKKTQYKTKEFELFLCQYLKNNIYNIRLILLDRVTYGHQCILCTCTKKFCEIN